MCHEAGGKVYCPPANLLSRPAGVQLHRGRATPTWAYNPVLGMQSHCGHPGDPESQSYLCATPPQAAEDLESQSYLRATPAWASQRIRESVLPVCNPAAGIPETPRVSPTCVVFIALSSAGEELCHGGAYSLRGASQVLSTLF